MAEEDTQDRYADLRTVMPRVIGADDFPDGNIRHLELRFLASGEVTWRATAKYGEEPVTGYLPPAKQ